MKFSAQRRRFVAASIAGSLAMGLAVSAGPVATADPVADPAGRTITLVGDRHQGLPGQYESTYSAKTNRLYVSAVSWADKAEDGTLVNGASTIAEVDPVTLKVTHAAPVPVEADDAKSSAYYNLEKAFEPVSPFGIAADDTRNLIWATDTVNDTVSAYDQATLKQVWRSPAGSLPHGREVSVMANGDVIVSGNGGLWRVTGTRNAFSINKYALNGGPTEAGIPMSMAQSGDEVYVNDVRLSQVRVLDEATGTLKRSFPMVAQSNGVSHGHLGVDAGLGVVVTVDQGVRDKATGAYSGTGVTFYKTDGTVLGRVAVGSHNLPLAIDQKNHIAYVGDWGGNGEVRAFDLQAALAGKPGVIGEIATTAGNGGTGINYLTMVGNRVFAVTKDEAYKGVTVPYGVDLKTGKQVAVKTDADSILMLDTVSTAKTYDPVKDHTLAGTTSGYDLSNLSLEPLPAGPLGFGSSLGTGSLGGNAGAPAGSSDAGIPAGSLGSLSGLGK